MNLFAKIANFFKEVRLEVKKVNWPTRQETLKYTLIVIVSSLLLAFFLGGLDLLFQLMIDEFIIK